MEHLEDHILPIEHIINQYVKEHLSDLKENQKENNNSFIFLEKGSLNLLLTSLLSMATNSTVNNENDVIVESILLEKLDKIIDESKNDFESILDLLREKT
ncbi:MAG: hypothetical protein ABS944_11730 [Solibacillus sp.]|uniref:hypothetical protein n=1 Tax=unclassified Solibacillus TaxID=2637870 RepID=UPI0030F83ECA